ncbi:MAG: hypothetical protein J6C80_01500 [Flavobacteriales bacterium]|nr:hypothetical protein [Flavobacteriales bacterium]
MTILEALKMTVGYPLDEKYLERIFIDRNIDGGAAYSGPTESFMLARADVYMMLSTTPSVTMDGFSITIEDREMLAQMAESIYRRYGHVEDMCITASGNAIKDSSHIW